MRTRPACCWIGRRDELGNDLGRGSKCCVVQYGQILFNRTTRSFRGQSLLALNAILPIGIGLDQAGIDRKTFAANQSLIDAAAQDGLKQPSQQIALPETTMAVLREGRMVGNIAIKPETAKPTIRQVQVDFFAEPPLLSANCR